MVTFWRVYDISRGVVSKDSWTSEGSKTILPLMIFFTLATDVLIKDTLTLAIGGTFISRFVAKPQSLLSSALLVFYDDFHKPSG